MYASASPRYRNLRSESLKNLLLYKSATLQILEKSSKNREKNLSLKNAKKNLGALDDAELRFLKINSIFNFREYRISEIIEHLKN